MMEMNRQACSEDTIPLESPTSLPSVGKRVWAQQAPVTDNDNSEQGSFHTSHGPDAHSQPVNHRLSPLDQWMIEEEDDDDDRTVTTFADAAALCVDFSRSTATASSAGPSDAVSSLSFSSSVSKRPNRKDYSSARLQVDNMEKALLQPCSCTRTSKFLKKSCHAMFNVGEILNMRRERVLMDQSTERKLCIEELTQAANHPDQRIFVGCKLVPFRECCIGGYILAYGLSRSTVHRMRQQLKGEAGMNVGAGRPKKTREDIEDDIDVGPSSSDHQYIHAWLNEWLELEGDKDPVGDECVYVLDLIDCKDVYEEFVADYNANTIFIGTRIASERTFKRVWDWWIVKNRIRIRDKKNTTTKCSGESKCDVI